MSKKLKRQVITNLVKRGEVFAAEVAAYDWHLIGYFRSMGGGK